MAIIYFRDPDSGQQVPVEILEGNPGSPGPAGAAVSGSGVISTDAGNNARAGSDGAVYVPFSADGGLPVATVVPYGGSIAPPGWHLCNGTAHGSAALAALIGPNTPNLLDRFIRGAGTQAPGMGGGANSAAITLADMPNHNHGITGNQSGDHTHTGTTSSYGSVHAHTGSTGTENVTHTHSRPAKTSGGQSANHTHVAQLNEGSGESGDSKWVDSNPNPGSGTKAVGTAIATTTNHTHQTAAVNTGGRSAGHTHAATSSSTNIDHTHSFGTNVQSAVHSHSLSAQGSGTGVPTVPVHYVLTYLIKGG